MISHRFNTLDGMRGIAAIAVMLGHLTQHSSSQIFQNARLAPDLFFCLSGFVLAFSYQKRLQDGGYFGAFAVRRLVRLYPMFLMGFGLGVVALAMKLAFGQTSLSPSQALLAAALNAFYLPYIGDFFISFGSEQFPSAIFPVNDPSWSLFFELVANLAFALWACLGARHARWIALASGLALFAYIFVTRQIEPGWGADNILAGLPRTAYGFFSGVCLHAIYPALKRHLPNVAPAVLIVVPIALFVYPDIRHEVVFYLGSVLFIVPPLVALGAVSHTGHPFVRSVCDYLGWISYPLYCLHFPIYSMATTIRGSGEAPLWLVLTLSGVALLVSDLAARWIDAPIRAKLTHIVTASERRRLAPSKA